MAQALLKIKNPEKRRSAKLRFETVILEKKSCTSNISEAHDLIFFENT